MPVQNFKRRKKRKRENDNPENTKSISQARKKRSHDKELLKDYARRVNEIKSYFQKYRRVFRRSLCADGNLDLVNLDAAPSKEGEVGVTVQIIQKSSRTIYVLVCSTISFLSPSYVDMLWPFQQCGGMLS